MKLLTSEEVAEITRSPVQTVWFWIRSGRLKASKPGKKYLISEDNLKDFLDNGRQDK